MPTSVAVALSAAAVSTSVTAALTAAGVAGAALLGAAAGALTAVAVGAIFTKKPQSLAEDVGRTATVRQAVAPWQWIYGEIRVGGTITFMETNDFGSQVNLNLLMVVTFAGHEVEEIGDIYFNDELLPPGDGLVTSGRFANWVSVFRSKGNESGQPFPVLVAEAVSWTDAHRQSGRAKLFVALGWNPDIFPNGVPNITAVIKGRKVYDPRSGLAAWTDNAALCIADWLTNRDVGLGADYATEIDEPQLIAAANVCDETVALAAGGTEKRYTINGALQAGETPRETLGRLNTAFNGFARFIGGKWKLYPAVYQAPSGPTLTADDLRGALRIIPRVSRRDLCNAVKGLYVSPDNLWQPSDFPPVTNATYQAEDQGERTWRELDLPYTNSPSMAQRLAKIELERVRQQIVVEWPGKLGCYRWQPGDTVAVTLDRYGWSGKVFEVVAVKLAFESVDGSVVLGCDLVLRETASAVYDWNAGEETEVDPAPDTHLPDPFNVGPPGAPSISESLYETRDGRGVGAKATLSWARSGDGFVRDYQPEFQLVGASAWTLLARTEDLTAEILDIAPGRYNFRVKAINQVGVASAYSTALDVEIKGLTTAPAAPTGLSVQAGGGTARLKIDQASALDVRRGGRVLVRFCHEGVTPAWESAFSIGEPDGYPGDATQIDLPLKPGTYLVKFRDSTGHESEGFASIATAQASVLTFTTLNTLTFDPDFVGTHSGTAAVGGVLTLGGVGLWDDIPDFDAVANVDLYGGIASSGSWTADTGLDLGSVKNVRLTSRLEGEIDNALDQIDDRTGDVDSWLDWDGASFGGSAADAWAEVRHSDDDVSYSVWKRLDAAEFRARYFEFRAQLLSHDPAYQPQLSVLRVTAEEVV